MPTPWRDHGSTPIEPAWRARRSAEERSDTTHLNPGRPEKPRINPSNDTYKILKKKGNVKKDILFKDIMKMDDSVRAMAGRNAESLQVTRTGGNSGIQADISDNRDELKQAEANAAAQAAAAEAGAEAAAAEELANQEDEPEQEVRKDGRKRRISGKVKAATAGGIVGVLGMFGGLGIFSSLQGITMFQHIANMLPNFHLKKGEGQMNNRVNKMFRYAKSWFNQSKDTPLNQLNRTRLGLLGNVFANRFESKLKAGGFTARVEGGQFKGWTIDPAKVMPDRDLKNMSEEEIKGNLSSILGADIDGGNKENGYTIDYKPNKLGYFSGNKLVASMGKQIGYSKFTGGLHARNIGKLVGVGWHPVKAVKEKFKGKLTDALRKTYKEQTRKMVKGIGKKMGDYLRGKDKNGQTDEFANLADEGDGVNKDEPGALSKFVDEKVDPKLKVFKDTGLAASITQGAATAVQGFCFLYMIGDKWPKIQMALDFIPMMNMGMGLVAMGQQSSDGDNPASDTPELDMGRYAYEASLLHDNATGSDWSDATSINGELGYGGSGREDIPWTAKPGPDNLFQSLHNLTTTVSPAASKLCDDLTSWYGQTFVTVVGFTPALGQGLKFALTQILKTVAIQVVKHEAIQFAKDSDVGQYLIKQVGQLFLNLVVDPLAKGAKRGNFINYGVKLFGEYQSIGNGGLKLSAANAAAIDRMQNEATQDEFNQKSFASRMFDKSDYRSAIGRFIDTQSPTPQAEFAKMGRGFLNLGSTALSMPGRLITSVTHAAPAYDYGFSDYGFTPTEMDNPSLDNPFDNAQKVYAIMSNDELAGSIWSLNQFATMEKRDVYILRAKYCFGLTLSKPQNENDPLTVKADPTMSPLPMSSQDDYPGNVTQDDMNQYMPIGGDPAGIGKLLNNLAFSGDSVGDGNCFDKSLDWTRIRMFIMDTNGMNTLACSNAQDSDATSTYKGDKAMGTEGKTACSDTGYGDGGGAGAGCGTDTGTATGGGGAAIWSDAPSGAIGQQAPLPGWQTARDSIENGSVSIVADAQKGKAIDFYADGSSTGNHQRVELYPPTITNPKPGQDVFVGFDIKFPEAPPVTDEWQEIMQLKALGGAGNPTFEFDVNYGSQGMSIAHNKVGGVEKTPAGNVPPPGTWSRFIIGFHVTNGPDSTVSVWQDGNNVANKIPWSTHNNAEGGAVNGGLLYQGDQTGYFKFGIYRGKTGAKLHFLYANLAIGTSCASVAGQATASTPATSGPTGMIDPIHDRRLRTEEYA